MRAQGHLWPMRLGPRTQTPPFPSRMGLRRQVQARGAADQGEEQREVVALGRRDLEHVPDPSAGHVADGHAN